MNRRSFFSRAAAVGFGFWFGKEVSGADAVNDFARTKMQEDGFLRAIMPPEPIPDDELDRRAPPGAGISLPFAMLPIDVYIRGPRYRVFAQQEMIVERRRLRGA
jgi:hypothetical protein